MHGGARAAHKFAKADRELAQGTGLGRSAGRHGARLDGGRDCDFPRAEIGVIADV